MKDKLHIVYGSGCEVNRKTGNEERRRRALLEKLMERYERQQSPISVDFREMVSWIKSPDRYTHMIHPYPAKLLVHIPHLFLSNDLLSKPGDTVLDPFCGSGTVLLEAILNGRSAIGVDCNPLACLISRVKTTPISSQKLQASFRRLMDRVTGTPSASAPDVVNMDYWFYPHVQRQLVCILDAIEKTRDPQLRDFFLVAFSNCVRKVSLADPRVSVPVRLREGQYSKKHPLRRKTAEHLRRLRRINVKKLFCQIVQSNMTRMATLDGLGVTHKATVALGDVRSMEGFPNGANSGNGSKRDSEVQLIVTSPPYIGAQKYIRSSSLSLGWLRYCKSGDLRAQKSGVIGREEYRKKEYEMPLKVGLKSADLCLARVRKVNPLRAHIAAQYIAEMKEAFGKVPKMLKPGGFMVLVAGNNTVCGLEFDTSSYLKGILESLGLSLKLCLIDDIRSRGLMTRRNKTASIITREWVMVFQKTGEGVCVNG